MLVNARSSADRTGPAGRFGSAVSSCQAQNWPDGVLNPSGCVPVGEMIAYWASRFEAAVRLPEWWAAATASAPSWLPVALDGAGPDSSTHTPASAPPAG